MIWNSDRSGYRSHGSWGSESDTYIMFFDVDAYNRFTMSKEDLALLEEAEKQRKKKRPRRRKRKLKRRKIRKTLKQKIPRKKKTRKKKKSSR